MTIDRLIIDDLSKAYLDKVTAALPLPTISDHQDYFVPPLSVVAGYATISRQLLNQYRPLQTTTAWWTPRHISWRRLNVARQLPHRARIAIAKWLASDTWPTDEWD